MQKVSPSASETQCESETIGFSHNKPTDLPPDVKSFYLHVAEGNAHDPRRYVEVRAELVKLTPRLVVYWDPQLLYDERRQAFVESLIEMHENEVRPEIERRLGPAHDTDGNGRLTVLFTPWLDRLDGGRTSLRGMVRGTDFRADLPLPYSHQTDMLYLNPLAPPLVDWKDILMHEYTHVVCCSRRMRRASDIPSISSEHDWIQEGIAHTLEPLGFNQDKRIADYLSAPHEYPLAVADYYRAGLWRNDGCRGATSLFHRWLTDAVGEQWLKKLADSTSQGLQSIETAAGVPFEDVFRGWTIDLLTGVVSRELDHTGLQPSFEMTNGYRMPFSSKQNRNKGKQLLPDLHGRLGRYQLQGPRVEAWDVDNGDSRIDLRGTSASFWILTASSASQNTHDEMHRLIEIQGDAHTRLQVTLIPLAETEPPPSDMRMTRASTDGKSVSRLGVGARKEF